MPLDPLHNLIGNEQVKGALRRMAEQKCVPNTLLFSGPDAIGKSLFATAFAKMLMGPAHAPKLDSQNHPDLHIYRPEGKASVHTLESMRKLIQEMALPPNEAPVKIFLIHDAHQMLPPSSNALLKTLEEPSLDSYLILLSSNPDALLPTLLSRCPKIPFFSIPEPQIASYVQQKWKKTPQEARQIAFLAHGSLGKAELLSSKGEFSWRAKLLELLRLRLLPQDYPEWQKIATELEEEYTNLTAVEGEDEKESGEAISASTLQADALFEEILAWYRDLHLLKEGVSQEYLYHRDSLDHLRGALSQPIPPLERVLEQIAGARLALQRSIKLRSVLEFLQLALVCSREPTPPG